MREIKLRAWDDGEKKWLCGYEYENLGGFSLFGETVLLGQWASVLNTYLFDRGGHQAEHLKVMQYTGLKDKNGMEIYEGDVIEKKQGDQKFRYDVRFSSGAFGIEFPPPSYTFKTLHELFYTFRNKYEIIGNIYENPDLLSHPIQPN
jgi:hypothetical protein